MPGGKPKNDPHTSMAASSAEAFARIGWDNTEARRGAEELVKISEQVKKRSEAALGSIGSGVKFAAAFAGLESAGSAIQKVFSGIGRGFAFNQTLSDAEVGISNILRRFDGLNKVAAKNEASKALARLVELEPTTAGGLQDLVSGFMGTLAASKGVGLSTAQNIELVAQFANAIANAGLPLDQIRQEFRSILTGTITKDSQIAKILGITNEDIAALKGDGEGLFNFLRQKLGAFAEAGDSAAVAFSSMNSAIDKALGAATKQLFILAVDSAKYLAKQLENPKWVDDMRAAGVDLAKVAYSLSEIGKVIIKWLPSAIQLGASFAEMIPSIAAVGVALAALKIGSLVKEKVAFTKATIESTQAINSETAALKQHAVAQQIVDKRSRFVGPSTRGAAWESSIDIGTAVTAARRDAEKVGMSFWQGLNKSMRDGRQTLARIQPAFINGLTSMNGMAPLIMSSLTSAVADRSKGFGGLLGEKIGGPAGAAMAPAMLDGLSVALSAMGPKGALAALGIQFVEGASAIGYRMGQAMMKALTDYRNPEAANSRQRNGGDDIRKKLDEGKNDEAKKMLESRLKQAEESLARARSAGENTWEIQNELEILQDMEKHWDAIIAKSSSSQAKQKAELEATEAQQEAAAKKKAEEDEKRLKAWQEIHSLSKDIQDSKINLLPDEQKLAAFESQLRRVFENASLGVGRPGQILNLRDLEAEAASQRSGGNATGTALTLARLKEALAIQQKIDSLTTSMKEKAAETSKEQTERRTQVTDKREILELEMQINRLLKESGGVETEAVKAVRDQIAVKERARDLQQSLNVSAAEALRIAQLQVQAERAAADAAQKKRQTESLADMQKELEILRLQAAGRDVKARQMQRELDIQKEVKRLVEETGMAETKALQVATEKANLMDQIEKRKKNARYDDEGRRISDGRRQINSSRETFSRQPGGMGQSLLDEWNKTKKEPLRDTFKFPGLDEMKKRQERPLRDEFKFPALDGMKRGNQLEDKAKENAAEQAPAGNPAVNVGQTILQNMSSIIALLS